MKVKHLIEQLKMFGEDIEVYIQPKLDDWATPITINSISLIPAFVEEKYGLTQCRVLLTAYIPIKK